MSKTEDVKKSIFDLSDNRSEYFVVSEELYENGKPISLNIVAIKTSFYDACAVVQTLYDINRVTGNEYVDGKGGAMSGSACPHMMSIFNADGSMLSGYLAQCVVDFNKLVNRRLKKEFDE